MTEIIVHKGLKPKYWLRSLWWEIILCNLFTSYSKIWKEHPLVHYPLTIDIALGDIHLYYLKYGFSYVIRRINTYNKVLANRMSGEKEEDLQIKHFQRTKKLTNPISIEKQLEMEMQNLEHEYY